MAEKKIDPSLRLISEYLKIDNDSKFVIPEYQRAYSWSNDVQCDKLWEDITTFIQDEKKEPYFFGTVIVDVSTDGELRLIDGQQRTTTFILLMKALLMQIEKTLSSMPLDSESKDLKELLEGDQNKITEILYKVDPEGRQEIQKDWSKTRNKVLLESRSINEEDSYKNDLQAILEAKTYSEAEVNVHPIPGRRKDNRYTNFFRNFKYFYNRIGELKDSTAIRQFSKTFLTRCQIIEIKSWQTEQAIMMFNSLNSTGLPLSDADIISAQLSAKAGQEREDFNREWKEIKEITERLENKKIVDTNTILQQFMHICLAEQREVSEDKKANVTIEAMRSFYMVTRKDLLDNPLTLCSKFKKIAQIWDKIEEYPIVKLALKFNMNIKLFLVSYLYRFDVNELSQEKVKRFTECLIRLFAIMELSREGYSSSKFKIFLFTEQTKMVRSNIQLNEIIQDFDKHIAECWDYNSIKDNLLGYDKNILVFLNEYLFAKENNLQFDFLPSVQVEHIMPQSGHNIKEIRLDAGFNSTPEGIDGFKSLVDKIGNKVLLEEGINKAIGNEWFRSKKGKEGDERRYINSKYNMARRLAFYPSDQWTKEDINKATEEAAERICKFILNSN